MTREQRIERALREVVEFISAHPEQQESGLNYWRRTVVIGRSRLEEWEKALEAERAQPECRLCGNTGWVPYDTDRFRNVMLVCPACGPRRQVCGGHRYGRAPAVAREAAPMPGQLKPSEQTDAAKCNVCRRCLGT